MKRITKAGMVDGRGKTSRKEYFPGFGMVYPCEVEAYFKAAYKEYRAKNRLKLAALERFHGMGENEFKFRSKTMK